MNPDVESALARASNLISLKRYAQAEKELQNALQQDPSNWDAKLLGAHLLLLKGQTADALRTIRECLAERPDNVEARARLFTIHEARKEFAEAERLLIELIRDYPRVDGFWAEYARLMLETGHTDKAMKLADEAVRLGPTEAHPNLIHCLVSIVAGKGDGLEDRLAELVRKNPESRETLYVLLAKLDEQGRYKQANLVAQQLVRLDPSDKNAVQFAIQAAARNHWSLKIFWPLTRFGWIGSFGLWALFIGITTALALTNDERMRGYLEPLAFSYIVYCVASWVWPGILTKWISRRGVR